MPEHTPGPWVVDPKYPLTVRPTVPTDHILPDGTPQRHAVYSNVHVTDLASPIAYGPGNTGIVAHSQAYHDARRPIIGFDQAKANARLISASPELYAACQAVLRFADGTCSLDFMVNAAREAVAKAKGKADA